jgi:hypothetical protein
VSRFLAPIGFLWPPKGSARVEDTHTVPVRNLSCHSVSLPCWKSSTDW